MNNKSLKKPNRKFKEMEQHLFPQTFASAAPTHQWLDV